MFLFDVGWTKDTRDSGLAPTRGYRTSLDAVVGVGDLSYWVASASGQYYVPLGSTLPWPLTLLWIMAAHLMAQNHSLLLRICTVVVLVRSVVMMVLL
ncbi:hypothetical protein OURE66S_01391 [Oligella ureolytica]